MASKYLILALAAIIVQASAQCPCNRPQGEVFVTQQYVSSPQQIVAPKPCGCQNCQQYVIPGSCGCQNNQQEYIISSPQQIIAPSPCGCQNNQQQYAVSVPQQIVAPNLCGCQGYSPVQQEFFINSPQKIIATPYGSQIQQQGCNQPQICSQQCAVNIPEIVTGTTCGCQTQQLISNQACASPLYATPVVATILIDNSVSTSLANALQLLIVSDLIETTLKARDCSQIYYESPLVESYNDYMPYCQQSYGVPYEVDYIDSYGPVEYFNNCYQDFVAPGIQVNPCAAEVAFPSSIPATLTCQFGYMPTTVPVVTVDVQPLPYGSGCPSCGCGAPSSSSCGCSGPIIYY